MPATGSSIRALLIAHVPSRSVSALLSELANDGFSLAPEEAPDKVSWPSSAYAHSFVMAWFVGPRHKLAKWDGVPGVLGFTEDDGLSWSARQADD